MFIPLLCDSHRHILLVGGDGQYYRQKYERKGRILDKNCLVAFVASVIIFATISVKLSSEEGGRGHRVGAVVGSDQSASGCRRILTRPPQDKYYIVGN